MLPISRGRRTPSVNERAPYAAPRPRDNDRPMTAARVARLSPCEDSEYAEFVPLQVLEYARQLVDAGEGAADVSVAIARDRLQDLIADRLRGTGHLFLVARSEHETARIGWVWLSPAPDFLGPGHESTRWLSQLTVEQSYRGQGWGRAILAALEDLEVARGCNELWLRVFAWNLPARRLYESHGYELANQFTSDVHLRKRLERP